VQCEYLGSRDKITILVSWITVAHRESRCLDSIRQSSPPITVNHGSSRWHSNQIATKALILIAFLVFGCATDPYTAEMLATAPMPTAVSTSPQLSAMWMRAQAIELDQTCTAGRSEFSYAR
jgi:hypothetical protein